MGAFGQVTQDSEPQIPSLGRDSQSLQRGSLWRLPGLHLVQGECSEGEGSGVGRAVSLDPPACRVQMLPRSLTSQPHDSGLVA